MIRLEKTTKERLFSFKDKYNLRSCEEAVELMLRYFEEAGEDPTKPCFTAKAQLADMQKRLGQVIAFIREFEKSNLRPVLHEISKANRQIAQIIPPENERLFTQKDLERAVMALFDALRKK
jgi:hypothetical protein